jgi:hypothetical protein
MNRIGVMMLPAALTVAVCAAGCGSSSSSTAALTKAQFLTQANAICTAGNAKTTALATSLGQNPTKAKAIRIIETGYVPAIQSQINAVRGLAVQTADKAKLSQLLDLAQADLNKIKANPALVFGQASPFHDFAKQAQAYGLTQCAQGA